MDSQSNPAVAGPLDGPVRPAAGALSLTDKQIGDIAFAVLRAHNNDRLWRALTYNSGPYDVTTPTLALRDLASAFFCAGIAAADARAPMVTTKDDMIASDYAEWQSVVFTLMGHAAFLYAEGKHDMPAWFYGLAEKIARAHVDEAHAQRVRAVAVSQAATYGVVA